MLHVNRLGLFLSGRKHPSENDHSKYQSYGSIAEFSAWFFPFQSLSNGSSKMRFPGATLGVTHPMVTSSSTASRCCSFSVRRPYLVRMYNTYTYGTSMVPILSETRAAGNDEGKFLLGEDFTTIKSSYGTIPISSNPLVKVQHLYTSTVREIDKT
jgi:hypothetical protein